MSSKNCSTTKLCLENKNFVKNLQTYLEQFQTKPSKTVILFPKARQKERDNALQARHFKVPSGLLVQYSNFFKTTIKTACEVLEQSKILSEALVVMVPSANYENLNCIVDFMTKGKAIFSSRALKSVQKVARLLGMQDLAEQCNEAMSEAGVQSPAGQGDSQSNEDDGEDEEEDSEEEVIEEPVRAPKKVTKSPRQVAPVKSLPAKKTLKRKAIVQPRAVDNESESTLSSEDDGHEERAPVRVTPQISARSNTSVETIITSSRQVANYSNSVVAPEKPEHSRTTTFDGPDTTSHIVQQSPRIEVNPAYPTAVITQFCRRTVPSQFNGQDARLPSANMQIKPNYEMVMDGLLPTPALQDVGYHHHHHLRSPRLLQSRGNVHHRPERFHPHQRRQSPDDHHRENYEPSNFARSRGGSYAGARGGRGRSNTRTTFS